MMDDIPVGIDLFKEYAVWLREHRLDHNTPARFSSWLEEIYR
jgi:hypothetical protein